MSQKDTKLDYIFLGERLSYLIEFKKELANNLVLTKNTMVDYKIQYKNDLSCELFVIKNTMKKLGITNIDLQEYEDLLKTIEENIAECLK